MAADAGVDDVHIIAALALHRRMHEFELRHALGDRVYDAFEPRGLLYQHDAEDPDNLAFLGTTYRGEEIEINKRAAESDLPRYVNINLVAMDGGWKSTAVGLASYRSLRHDHNPTTMEAVALLHGPARLRTPQEHLAHGQGHARPGPKVFQIETTLNTDTFPHRSSSSPSASGSGTPRTVRSYLATAKSVAKLPRGAPARSSTASRRRTR